ncbi:hypothetical protein [Streptomyces sp. H39-S7]|uniref:hypothetical protein n=1 Tax=Streptomyces sp. H39-S7 TaxID=3004357 RepID=UPI0022AECFF9|nr:hypothetical protein [Streptomyces sp. H39-S7]MCZ4118089.1 hypothetical protein [Streptomyces sp. H39-S7]
MIQNDPAGSRCINLGASIREIVPTAVLVRVYPERRSVTHLFGSDFFPMPIDRQTEVKVAQMVRRHFGEAADWRRSHDFHIPTGALYLTPEPNQNGYIPEDDYSFGLSPFRCIAIANGDCR